MTRGMVLGKFMPPHAGHVYLVEFARRWADDVTVVVGSLAAGWSIAGFGPDGLPFTMAAVFMVFIVSAMFSAVRERPKPA